MNAPKRIISNEYDKFTNEGDVESNIHITIMPRFVIHCSTKGKLIHKRELEWYITNQEKYFHRIVMRDEKSSKLVALMKANREWTNIFITYIPHYPNIEFIIHAIFVEIVFRNRILFHDGLVVHASAVVYKDYCILFSAPSGTGKSTQAKLWEKYLKAVVINDDHPAIKCVNNKTFVYGTPWAGSGKKLENKHAPLKAVIILEQSQDNTLRKLPFTEAINHFLPRFFLPYYNNELMKKAMDLFEAMFLHIPVYLLKCKPDRETVYMVLEEVEKNQTSDQ